MANSPFPDQAVTLGSLLRGSYRKLSARIYEEVRAGGFPEIRPSHSAVFRNISPEGSRLTDLADRAGLTKQSMAYLVAHLEGHGYLKVGADPVDGRAKRVKLTAKGNRLVDTLLEASAAAEKRLAAAFGDKAYQTLRAGLVKLGEAMDQPF